MSTAFDFDQEIDRRVTPALKWRQAVAGAQGEGLFPAGVADMDFRAPPAVLAAMQARLEHGVFGYEAWPETLLPALTGWLAQRHGWQVEPDHILRAPNVLNALSIAAAIFSDPGDAIIIQPPVSFDFQDVIRENHREILLNPLLLENGRYRFDLPGLEALAARPEARILFLCNPHNPVGRAWSRSELSEIDRICRTHGVLVVADEIHGDITLPDHHYTPFASLGPEAAANCLAVISPAKSFNIASCCQAFAILADDARRRAYQAESSRMNANKNNAFASVAMVAAYSEGAAWLDALRGYLAGNLALLRRRLAPLEGVALIEPEATFLAWLDFRALGLEADDLDRFLREKVGWAVTRGAAFGAQGAGFARFNFACPRPRLSEALERLQAAL